MRNACLIIGVGLILLATTMLSYWVGWQMPDFFSIFVKVAWYGLTPIAVTLFAFGRWRCAFLVGALIAATLAYPFLTKYFAPQKTRDAQKYVADLAPLLEAYRKENGTYPDHLGAVKNLPTPPWYLNYGGDADGYRFIYPSWGDPHKFGFWQYGSICGQWKLHT